MANPSKAGPCTLCGRHTELTFHHLVPRKVHRRNFFRKAFEREVLQQGVDLCRLCHKGLHRLYDEMTLAKQLNTLEALRADPAIQRHVHWVRKQRTRPVRD
jgi:5-methylcytosine-specific restriction endonuclease McrA